MSTGAYTSPGVYVKEVSSGIQPIAGVGTSTAGFIGYVAHTVSMPTYPGTGSAYAVADELEPTLITSWQAFKNHFGDFQESNKILAHAVYGFFNNGGTRCWVARVEPPAAEPTLTNNLAANPAIDNTKLENVLTAFDAIDEIAIYACPGAVDKPNQSSICTHCDQPSMQNRFAILDGAENPDGLESSKINPGGTSDYAALYFPWIEVYDPVSKGSLAVPPSGHIAGIYARVDETRGVHKAPANEIILGALDVEHPVSKNDQGNLNQNGINVIRNFNNNVTVWGARTLGGTANQDLATGDFMYISVRRLFIFLRTSIEQGLQWVVFEPNDQRLWAKIIRNVTAFLTNVWNDGALFGATPAEAFFVKCDAETNPPEVRDLGMVVTQIGVAVVKPAEFVIFNISQSAGPAGS